MGFEQRLTKRDSCEGSGEGRQQWRLFGRKDMVMRVLALVDVCVLLLLLPDLCFWFFVTGFG